MRDYLPSSSALADITPQTRNLRNRGRSVAQAGFSPATTPKAYRPSLARSLPSHGSQLAPFLREDRSAAVACNPQGRSGAVVVEASASGLSGLWSLTRLLDSPGRHWKPATSEVSTIPAKGQVKRLWGENRVCKPYSKAAKMTISPASGRWFAYIPPRSNPYGSKAGKLFS